MKRSPDDETGLTAQSSAAADIRVGRFRYVMVSLLLVTMIIASADRVNLSLLLVDGEFLRTMGIENQPAAQGVLMSAFVLAYGLGNVVFGPAIDWFGGRRALLVMHGLWSGLGVFTASVGAMGPMIIGRILRGGSEGPIFPTMNHLVRGWFPSRERGQANAIWVMGPSLGMAATVPVLALVIPAYGWRVSFLAVAALSLLLGLPATFVMISDRPTESRWVNAAEAAHIESGVGEGIVAPRWRDALLFIGNYRYWLLVAYHLASLAILWGLVTWLPKYLVEARGMDITISGLLTAVPYIVAALSTLLFGWLSDRLSRRAPFCALQMLGGAAALFAAASVESATASVALMAIAFGFWGMGAAVTHTLVQSIVPAGVISTGSGIDNGVANLGAAACPALVGYTIGVSGSYFAGLMVLVAAAVVGGLLMVVLSLQDY